MKQKMSIGLENQIIIIDEAHNIEDSSRDAASVLITRFQLEQACLDLNKVIDPNLCQPEEDVRNVCQFFIETVKTIKTIRNYAITLGHMGFFSHLV